MATDDGLVFMILIIDNYDSFTYNLAAAFKELKKVVTVKRNDQISLLEIYKLNPSFIVLSPGPCTPEEAGISKDIVKEFMHLKPILGVCLGHQTIAASLGGKIIRAPQPVHGVQDEIFHNGLEIFENLPNPITAARYHSLIVAQEQLPYELDITSKNKEGLIMAVKHIRYPCFGVQFHPESILTTHGKQILINFLSIGENYAKNSC